MTALYSPQNHYQRARLYITLLKARDPVSITTSAAAIIQFTTKLMGRGTPKETAELAHELESFEILLESLKNIF